MAESTDDDDLRARVAELEQTVAQQRETIESMRPGRRGVLKGAALLGGGALVGAGTADRASAQASGQVGTSSDPVDVEAYDLAVQNQLSSSVDAGGNDLTNLGSVKTDDLALNSPSGIGEVGSIATDSFIVAAEKVTLADEESAEIIGDFPARAAMTLTVANTSRAAVVTAVGGIVSIQEQIDTWAASDTDGQNCVFKDGTGSLVVKNRTGQSRDYSLVGLGVDGT